MSRSLPRRPVLCAGLMALLVALPMAAAAQDFPTKPLTLVVPFPPGGSADVVARILGKALSDRLKQSVVVDNRPGAGTELAAAAVARAPADGYTLMYTSNSTFTVNPAIKPRLQYDAERSFEAVGLIGSLPLAVLARPDFPAANAKELVALAKAKPGKLSYASFGTATTSHLAGEMFKVMAGIDILHVPYKGSAPAMSDLLGGQVDLSVDTVLAALPQLRAGKIKVLAITSAKRTPFLPEVPTLAESGHPQMELVSWGAVVAPRGLPAAARKVLGQALQSALEDPAVRAQLEKTGLEVGFQPPAAFDARLARELPLLRAYVARAGIRPD